MSLLWEADAWKNLLWSWFPELIFLCSWALPLSVHWPGDLLLTNRMWQKGQNVISMGKLEKMWLPPYEQILLGLLVLQTLIQQVAMLERPITLSCFSHVWLCVTPWTAASQAPLSMGFPKQEYWSGLPFPFPGDLPDPGTEPVSFHLLHCRQILYHWAIGEAWAKNSIWFCLLLEAQPLGNSQK